MNDEVYRHAVESGDLETAQRMVDEAARRYGYTIGPVYHRSTNAFTVFDTEIGGGAHFGTRLAACEAVARRFSLVIDYEVEQDDGGYYVIPDNGPHEGEDFGPFDTRESALSFIATQPKELPEYRVYLKKARIKNVEDAGTSAGWEWEAERARREGYDLLCYINQVEDPGSVSYVVLRPDLIKSADAVTYDDHGRLVPLSQRFGDTIGAMDIRHCRNGDPVHLLMPEDDLSAPPEQEPPASSLVFQI